MNDSLTHGGGAPEEPVAGDHSSFPTDAELSRTLVSSCRIASLSTITKTGYPYGSVVSYVDADGSPVLLISDLAEHTINARSNPKASLLISEAPTDDDPLGNARLTLVGKLQIVEEASDLRQLYLNRHPYSKFYSEFNDFNFWRFVVESCRYVGGFGHMSWVDAEGYSHATVDPLHEISREVVNHMNADHSEANLLYVQVLANLPDSTEATMVGIDRHGVTLRASTPNGPRLARVRFPVSLDNSDEARPAVISLLDLAKAGVACSE